MPIHLTSSDFISIAMGLGQIITSIILAMWAIRLQTPKPKASKRPSKSTHLFFQNLIKTWPLWIPIFASIFLLYHIGNSSEALTRATVIRAVLHGFIICTGFLFSIFIAIVSTLTDIIHTITELQTKSVQHTTDALSTFAELQTETVQQTKTGFALLHRYLLTRHPKKSQYLKKTNSK